MQGENGEMVVRYRGRSMWPLFKDGDLLVTRFVPPEQLRIGDCIAFRGTESGVELVVHRIVALAAGIRTKGDHRPTEDDHVVRPEDIAGRVVARFRFGVRSAVAGGRRGRAIAQTLQWIARVDPSRHGVLGRVARGVRVVVSTFTATWLANVARVEFKTEKGHRRETNILRGCPVATCDHERGRWLVEWPHTLWINDERLPASKGQRDSSDLQE